jgi:hypothetical protein
MTMITKNPYPVFSKTFTPNQNHNSCVISLINDFFYRSQNQVETKKFEGDLDDQEIDEDDDRRRNSLKKRTCVQY